MEDRSAHPHARRDSNLMRSVNTNLRSRSETLSEAEPIAFFCECAQGSCYAPIWMSAERFDDKLTAEPGWLLHEGHAPSALWHRREPLPTRTSRHAQPASDLHGAEPRATRRLRPLPSLRVGLANRHGNRGHAEAA